MKPSVSVLILACVLGATAAAAQTGIAPMAPPVTSSPPQAPGSSLSPILTNPGLAQTPYSRPPANSATSTPAPINQQNMQSYRNELMSNQRLLDRQGVSPGSEAYRTNQQQLNQLNGASR